MKSMGHFLALCGATWVLIGCASAPPQSDAQGAAAAPAAVYVDTNDTDHDNPSSGFIGFSKSVSGSAWAKQSGRTQLDWLPQAPPAIGKPLDWEVFRTPGKTVSRFEPTQLDGVNVLQATSQDSGGLLRQRFNLEPQQLGRIRFSWKVPQTIDGAQVGSADMDDAPVRVVLAFEGDRAKLSLKNSLLSELSRLLVNEELPYATLSYVWSNVDPPGTVVQHARTDRVRSIVLESGSQNLNRWLYYDRDIVADYVRVYGEPPGRLFSIGVQNDSSNTSRPVVSWFGPVILTAPQR